MHSSKRCCLYNKLVRKPHERILSRFCARELRLHLPRVRKYDSESASARWVCIDFRQKLKQAIKKQAHTKAISLSMKSINWVKQTLQITNRAS